MLRPVLLCIDDDLTLLHIRKLVLQAAGYEVRVAASGEEGLRIFQHDSVDAVLLDFAMPGMDGGEVAQRIRQLKPLVPIILLSAYLFLPDEVLRQVDAYIAKGQPPSVLLQELNELLGSRPHSHPELAGDCVAYVDRTRRCIDASNGFCALVGYSRGELLGKKVDELLTFAPQPGWPQLPLRAGRDEGYHTLRRRDGGLVRIHYHSMLFPDGCLGFGGRSNRKRRLLRGGLAPHYP